MDTATPLERHDLETRHWWFRGRRRAVRALGQLLVPPGGTVVQLGCGTGDLIGAFSSSFERVGLDPSPASIEAARDLHPGVRFDVGSVREAVRADAAADAAGGPAAGSEADAVGRADLVVVCDVLEHEYDDVAFLRNLLEGMKSGAHVLLTVPAARHAWSPDGRAGDVRRYTRASLSRAWRGLPATPRLLAPLNGRVLRLARPIPGLGRRAAAAGASAARAGSSAAGASAAGASAAPVRVRVPPAPLNRGLERLFAGEVPRLVAALKTSPREVPGPGTSLLAVLEASPVPAWKDVLPWPLAVPAGG